MSNVSDTRDTGDFVSEFKRKWAKNAKLIRFLAEIYVLPSKMISQLIKEA